MNNSNNNLDVWVIKDNYNYFAHDNSIRKYDPNTWMYISYKTFDPACRGYLTNESANKALEQININKDIMGINTKFRLEKVNYDIIIKQYQEFNGENLKIQYKSCFEKAI